MWSRNKDYVVAKFKQGKIVVLKPQNGKQPQEYVI